MMDLARELRIRDAWLLAIEEGRLDDLPAGPFQTGYVRSYADRLGLDGAALAARLGPARAATGGGPRIRVSLRDEEGHVSGRRVLALAAVLVVPVCGGWYLAADVGVPPDRTVPIPELSRGPAAASPVAGEGRDAAPVPEPAAVPSGTGSAVPTRSEQTGAGRPYGARNMARALPTGEAAAKVPKRSCTLDRETAGGFMRPSVDTTRSTAPGPPNAERIRAVQRALGKLGYDPALSTVRWDPGRGPRSAPFRRPRVWPRTGN